MLLGHLSFETTGQGRTPYPPHVQRILGKVMASWQAFCRMPLDYKSMLTYQDEDSGDTGYEFKSKTGSTTDYKENFHVSLGGKERLIQLAETVHTTCSRAAPRDLLRNAQELLTYLDWTVQEIAFSLETTYDLPGLMDEVMAGQDEWVLRLLHYFGGQPIGSVSAAPHADKSGFTLHLFESAPGLEYLGRENPDDWRPMPVTTKETVVIPGLQMQLRSRNRLYATCHRVVVTSEAKDPMMNGRYSAVCFIPLPRTPAFNKRSVGRTQDLVPGFNYAISHEEFAELFR
jgi:isopenicillin N synthase-like dioxygenase